MKKLLVILVILLAGCASEPEEQPFDYTFTGNSVAQEHYVKRMELFIDQVVPENPVVLWGDSITELMEADPLPSNVVNRGIGGMNTFGASYMIPLIDELKPEKVFLLIGTNDLTLGYRVGLEGRIQTLTSHLTDYYVVSLLPVRDNHIKNIQIVEVNNNLRRLYGDRFLDVHDLFLDASGQLSTAHSDDGLHLNRVGRAILENQYLMI